MARLDRRDSLPAVLRARDLAALNITAPLRHVSARERLRFLDRYSEANAKALLPLIRIRVNHLLHRRKFFDFSLPNDSGKETASALNTPPVRTAAVGRWDIAAIRNHGEKMRPNTAVSESRHA
jgi:hypothetical protein